MVAAAAAAVTLPPVASVVVAAAVAGEWARPQAVPLLKVEEEGVAGVQFPPICLFHTWKRGHASTRLCTCLHFLGQGAEAVAMPPKEFLPTWLSGSWMFVKAEPTEMLSKVETPSLVAAVAGGSPRCGQSADALVANAVLQKQT